MHWPTEGAFVLALAFMMVHTHIKHLARKIGCECRDIAEVEAAAGNEGLQLVQVVRGYSIYMECLHPRKCPISLLLCLCLCLHGVPFFSHIALPVYKNVPSKRHSAHNFILPAPCQVYHKGMPRCTGTAWLVHSILPFILSAWHVMQIEMPSNNVYLVFSKVPQQ